MLVSIPQLASQETEPVTASGTLALLQSGPSRCFALGGSEGGAGTHTLEEGVLPSTPCNRLWFCERRKRPEAWNRLLLERHQRR